MSAPAGAAVREGTGAADAHPGSSFGLRPRPSVDPVVAALLAEAALELWPRPPVMDPAAEAARGARAARAERAWRFSGRWWTRPVAVRRDRPWVR
ncbi:MAG TPA: hypothetical protein VMD28_06605 [Acidimicrobiales bacterium]|nr:hypothetical protein [Acidimicrobiales bacterium]